jgi:KUP system potassium uptake protein
MSSASIQAASDPARHAGGGADLSGSLRAGAMMTALGVVYGDIGTSPLYAFKASMDPLGNTYDPSAPLGIASLIVLFLTLIIAVKYIMLVLPADHDGEGGILALTALLNPWGNRRGAKKCGFSSAVILLGLVGCALLFGDGVITPAISVLSAVEGLKTVFPDMPTCAVLGLTICVLAGLFAVQHKGTNSIGRVFGPVMLVWFLSIGALGAWNIARHPGVLAALNPLYGIRFAIHEPAIAAVFGAVFLALTGGEAMYADMGHCGRTPIRAAWFAVVMPALALNYLGQAAAVTADPHMLQAAGASPFFGLAPEWLRLPLVAIATAATIIASQALISGVFSLVRQAVTLGLCPRFTIRQTFSGQYGQIYVPGINWALMVGCIVLVMGFRSSDAMASAYGIAVSVTMLITTVLIGFAMRSLWRWPLPLVALFMVFFGAIDMVFVGSNMLKVAEGGWVPLMIGIAALLLMRIWSRSTALVRCRLADMAEPVETLFSGEPLVRIPGRIQVFLTKTAENLPPVLCEYAAKTGSLAEHVVIVTFVTVRSAPFLHRSGNVRVTDLGHGLWRITAKYGYMQTPRVGAVLREAEMTGLPLKCREAPIILGNETVSRKEIGSGLSGVTAAVYQWMLKNSARADRFFKIKAERVIEIGVRIEV